MPLDPMSFVLSHREVLKSKEDDLERTEKEELECNLQNIPWGLHQGIPIYKNDLTAYLHFSDDLVFVNFGETFYRGFAQDVTEVYRSNMAQYGQSM
jgi:hypothetical protein